MEVRGSLRGALIATAVLVVVALAGCGGGGSNGSSSSGSTSNSAKTDASHSGASAGSGSEPSAEFRGKGPNSELATVGKEADEEEREAVSSLLEENLEARAAGNWEGQCATLAVVLIKQLEKTASSLGAGPGCAKALEAQAKPVPSAVRANPMTGPIAAFRVAGKKGFALFHGAKGKDYVMPLVKEGSEWKVISLTTQEAP